MGSDTHITGSEKKDPPLGGYCEVSGCDSEHREWLQRKTEAKWRLGRTTRSERSAFVSPGVLMRDSQLGQLKDQQSVRKEETREGSMRGEILKEQADSMSSEDTKGRALKPSSSKASPQMESRIDHENKSIKTIKLVTLCPVSSHQELHPIKHVCQLPSRKIK